MAQIKYYTGKYKNILEQNIRGGAAGYNNKDIILYSDGDNDYIYVVNSNPSNISYLSFKNNSDTHINQLYNRANAEPNRSSYWQTPNGNKRHVNSGMGVDINEAFNNVTTNNGINVSNFSKWLQGNHSSNAHTHNFSYTAYWSDSNVG